MSRNKEETKSVSKLQVNQYLIVKYQHHEVERHDRPLPIEAPKTEINVSIIDIDSQSWQDIPEQSLDIQAIIRNRGILLLRKAINNQSASTFNLLEVDFENLEWPAPSKVLQLNSELFQIKARSLWAHSRELVSESKKSQNPLEHDHIIPILDSDREDVGLEGHRSTLCPQNQLQMTDVQKQNLVCRPWRSTMRTKKRYFNRDFTETTTHASIHNTLVLDFNRTTHNYMDLGYMLSYPDQAVQVYRQKALQISLPANFLNLIRQTRLKVNKMLRQPNTTYVIDLEEESEDQQDVVCLSDNIAFLSIQAYNLASTVKLQWASDSCPLVDFDLHQESLEDIVRSKIPQHSFNIIQAKDEQYIQEMSFPVDVGYLKHNSFNCPVPQISPILLTSNFRSPKEIQGLILQHMEVEGCAFVQLYQRMKVIGRGWLTLPRLFSLMLSLSTEKKISIRQTNNEIFISHNVHH